MKSADLRTRKIIEKYFEIPVDQQDLLLEQLEPWALKGGEWLFRQGDPGDSLYLLVRGRLQVWLDGHGSGGRDLPKIIGRVAPGDSVGEVGLLTGGPRSAGIRAIRDSQLIRISRAAFKVLSQQHPALVMHLAGRAAALVQLPKMSTSGSTRNLSTIALVPLERSERTRLFCQQLTERLQNHGTIRLLDQDGLAAAGAPGLPLDETEPVPDSLVRWQEEQENHCRLLVFQCEPGTSQWTRFALRQSDLVILVGEHQCDHVVRSWETELGLGDPESNMRRILVLLQGDSKNTIENTAAWYTDRILDFHLHVRDDLPDDIARVARVIAGEATGLVLSAGASRGFAHLGVYRALQEAGVPIDWIGGTSIGAIMGAMMAFGWSPDECERAGRQSFVDGRPFSDFTLPLVSLLAGRRMKRLIRSQATGNIEDLPLPFFCISSNLNDGSANLHQMGSLSRALEATASMPGILPPTVVGQHLAIDGSVLNSLPVDVMWQQAVGKVIASDLAAQKTHTVDYQDIPSAWVLLRSKFWPLGKRYRVPSLMTLILKSTELATLQQVRAQGAQASLLLQPDVRRFGLTQVKAFDQIVEEGYRCAKEKIGAWLAVGDQGK